MADTPVGAHEPARSHWFTGETVRMCDCGTDQQVYTDGRHRYAHCAECGKVWDVDTNEEKP